MKLSSLLDSSFILTDSPATTKREAIEILLPHIYPGCDACQSREEVLQAILDREAFGSTTYPTGIAIPHGRLENFDDCVVGILVPRAPFEEGGVLIRMVVLILTSKLGSHLYLKVLAAFTKLSKDEDLFSRMISAGSGSALLSLLERERVEVEKDLTVVDIMSQDYPKVDPALSVKEVVDVFCRNRDAWGLVVDSSDRLLGVVSLFEIVGKGIPNYATLMGNLAFLPKLRPFEDLLKEEGRLRVEEIMSKPAVVLTPAMSIIEAAFEMIQHHRGTAPVVKDGQVLGVLRLVDIMTKYLRG